MKDNHIKAFLLFLVCLLCKTWALAQFPTCPGQLIYGHGNGPLGNYIVAYNPALPISATNPYNTSIPLPLGASGLALMPNINGGPGPTFYVTVTGNYYYWDGSSWINTGHTAGSVNIGGCGSTIYSIMNPNVYAYYGTGNATLLTNNVGGTIVGDIVADCECNFWVMSITVNNMTLRKYSPAGTLLATYTLTGFSGGMGYGFAIIGNTVYFSAAGGLYTGTIGPGSAINFSLYDPGNLSLLMNNDMANCPVASIATVTAATTGGTLSCAGNTVNMVITTTASPVSYSWSGPSITGSATGSIATAATAGVYTCVITPTSGCGFPATFTTQVNNNSCISVTSQSITCASLGQATVVSNGGIGPFSFTWMPSGQTSSVATGLSPGTYTVAVFDAGSNTSYTTTTVFTSLVPLTGTLNSTPSITCNGAATGTAGYSNLAGGSGSQNYAWTNGSITYTAPGPNNLSAGSWSVTVTDALTGCTINNIFFITQPPALTLNIAAGTPTACAGTTIVLTGTNSGGTAGYSYTWAAGPSTASYAISQNTGGTYTYTLSSLDANNCFVSNTISVGFVNNPTVSVSNVSICPLQTGTLMASGASTYTWSNNTSGSTFTDNPLITTQYTVIGSVLACTAAATASIILKPAPVPTLSTNGPLCNGDKLLLTASVGSSYNWTGPPAFSSSVQNPTINPAAVNNAGAYNVTVTAANNCTAAASINLTVYPTPTLAAVGSTVCTSQTMSLDASSMAGAGYLWSGPQSFTSNSQSVSVSNPTVNQSGTYTVVVTSVDGCTNMATTSASIVTPPNLGVSLSSSSLCAQALSGSPNTITLTSSGAQTYTLSTPNHLYNPNPSGPTSPLSMQPPYQMTGPATATLFGSNGVCTVSITADFTIVPNPTVTVSSPTPVICAGQSYTYTSAGANSYTWSAASPGSTVYITGSAVVASPTINSVFSVVGGSLGCNSAIQNSNITVNPLPQVLVDPLVLICKGNLAQLIANGPSTTYTWSPNLFLSASTGPTVNASPPALQNYMVIGSLNNCTTSAVVTVSILPLPIAMITTSTQNVCVNDNIVLQGSGGLGYAWSGPSGFSSVGQSIRFNALSTAYAGNYTLTVSDQNNCKGSTMQAITVYALPQGYFNSESLKGCAPLCTSLDLKTNAGSALLTNISWQANNQIFTGSNFKTCFNNPGNYKITGTLNDINNCVNTITAVVNVYPKPAADFSFYPAMPVENFDEVQFTNSSTGDQVKQWSWYFINNKGYRSNNENPSYLFTDAGIYPIALVVSNTWGCADSVVKTIKIESDVAIYVPNAFTPNNDGHNELFAPVGRGIATFAFSIFDRWGTKIFEARDHGWDGTYKGISCPEGVYAWKLEITTTDKQARKMTGEVMLYR